MHVTFPQYLLDLMNTAPTLHYGREHQEGERVLLFLPIAWEPLQVAG